MLPPRRIVPMLLAAAALAGAAGAQTPPEPLDLEDPRPRSAWVRFESTPLEETPRAEPVWGEPIRARVEAAEPDRLRVVVPAAAVETRLFVGQGVVPQSFGDFVWVFDRETGHVVSATLEGSLRRPLALGPFRMDAHVQLDLALSTRRGPVAFRDGRRVFGELIHELCEDPADDGCRPAIPRPYDPATGRVVAVGALQGRTGPIRSRSFSPLGEARFLEAEGPSGEGHPAPAPSLPTVAAGPPERGGE